MYAAHNNCTHGTYMYSDVCNLMHVACVCHVRGMHVSCTWHACGAEPIFVYAAHMCMCCSMCAAYMHSMCSKEADICAAHKQHFCKGAGEWSGKV